MTVSTRSLLVAVFAAAALSCDVRTPVAPTSIENGSPTTAAAASLGAATRADFTRERTLCLDETNRYRASVGKPALTRSDALEAFATEAAQHDAQVRQAHHYFKTTNGKGIAFAENEILWWKGFSVREVVQMGLAQMWDSGPSGEHYDIIVGPYTQVGCGIFVSGDEVTVAQDFR